MGLALKWLFNILENRQYELFEKKSEARLPQTSFFENSTRHHELWPSLSKARLALSSAHL
jgi:hypothetical protein